jgi:hypothetical protein
MLYGDQTKKLNEGIQVSYSEEQRKKRYNFSEEDKEPIQFKCGRNMMSGKKGYTRKLLELCSAGS